jgi:uncharacterized membrane protein YoaT (DUF817 family)
VDAVIVAAVNDRVGPGLAVAVMKSRMHAWSYPDFTDYYLDGQPLVRVYVPSIAMDGGKITAVVRHVRLCASADSASRACAFGG